MQRSILATKRSTYVEGEGHGVQDPLPVPCKGAQELLVVRARTQPFKLGVEVAQDIPDFIIGCHLFVIGGSLMTLHHSVESAR